MSWGDTIGQTGLRGVKSRLIAPLPRLKPVIGDSCEFNSRVESRLAAKDDPPIPVFRNEINGGLPYLLKNEPPTYFKSRSKKLGFTCKWLAWSSVAA